MAKVLEAIVEINGRDKTGSLFSRIFGKASAAERKLQALGQRHVIAAQRARGMVAAVGELAAGMGAVEIARKSITTYMDLERTMTDLGITAGATDGQIKAATKSLQDQAPAIGQTGEQWGEVAQNLVAAGMGFSDAIGATPVIAKTAKAEAADLLEVSAAGNASMQILKVGVSDLGKAMDIMAAGGKAGSFEIKNMAREFPAVASSASRLGFQGTDGVARLVAMLEVAVKTAGDGSQAATNMRQAFDKMYSPTVTNAWAKVFKKNSLPSILEDAGKKGQNKFEAVLDFLEKKTKGMSETAKQSLIGKIFTDEQARNGILAMLKFKDEYQRILGEVRNSQGTVDSDLQRRLGTTVGHWDRAIASLNRSMAKFGEGLAPGVSDFADKIAGLTAGLEDLKSTMETTKAVGRGFWSGLFGDDKDVKGKSKEDRSGLGGVFSYLWSGDPEKDARDWFKRNFNSSEPVRTAPNEPFRGRRLWKSDAEAAEAMGRNTAVALTGGKVPVPKSGDGLDVKVPDFLRLMTGTFVEMTKRIEKAYPANAPLLPSAARIDAAANRLRADGLGSDIATTQQQRDAWQERESAKRSEAANGGIATRYFAGAEADRSAGKAAELQTEINRLVAERERLGLGPGRSPTGPAQPQPPVDVTGKVQLDPNSKASVEVRVKVEGPGTVTGMSASGGGNLKANVGVSMAPAHTSRRDE